MATLWELPAIWRDELLSMATGPIIPYLKLTVTTQYKTGTNPDGSVIWSTDYLTVDQDFSDRVADVPIQVSYSKPILPNNEQSENIITVSDVQFTLLNPDEAFAAIQQGARFDPKRIEQIRVVIGATVGAAAIPFPVFQGRVTQLPTEQPGKTIFTARADIYRALKAPVLFERFSSIVQFAQVNETSVSSAPYFSTSGIVFHDAFISWTEEARFQTSIINQNSETQLRRVKILNKAKPGKYRLDFLDNQSYTISYPGGYTTFASSNLEIASDFVTIKNDYWTGSVFLTINILDVGTNAPGAIPDQTVEIVYASAITGVPVTLFSGSYIPTSENINSLAEYISTGINDWGAAGVHAWTATHEGNRITATLSGVSMGELDSLIFVSGSSSDFASSQSAIRIGDVNYGSSVEWYVSPTQSGNPITIAANLIEKGITGAYGDEPTRPASIGVDWDTFEELETAFNEVVIYYDFTNLNNSAWERRQGNYPGNSLTEAQKCLDHVGCRITIDTYGTIRLVGPNVLSQAIYQITDEIGILEAEIIGRIRATHTIFQYGGNLLNSSMGGSIEKFDATGFGERVDQFVSLPFYKVGKSEDFLDEIADSYMRRLINPNARFRLVFAPNWGLSLRPGDRFRLTLNNQPRFNGFVEVYQVTITIGGTVTVLCHEISGIIEEICAKFDEDRFDIGIYC